jgi:hypothetical protein
MASDAESATDAAELVADEARRRAEELADADQRADDLHRQIARLHHESEERRQQHVAVEHELRTALEAEEERRRALERRVFELETVASEAGQLIEDMERARGRVGRALNALGDMREPAADKTPEQAERTQPPPKAEEPADSEEKKKQDKDDGSDDDPGGDKPHLRAIRE